MEVPTSKVPLTRHPRYSDHPSCGNPVGEKMLREWQAGVCSLCEGKTIHLMGATTNTLKRRLEYEPFCHQTGIVAII
ncbi:MAG: hypothetical protein E5X77_12840 [Mesorhizobium sp.]|nr:MAG: hypothetical protein E5X77_12840 [Mesorhizobium sp.]